MMIWRDRKGPQEDLGLRGATNVFKHTFWQASVSQTILRDAERANEKMCYVCIGMCLRGRTCEGWMRRCPASRFLSRPPSAERANAGAKNTILIAGWRSESAGTCSRAHAPWRQAVGRGEAVEHADVLGCQELHKLAVCEDLALAVQDGRGLVRDVNNLAGDEGDGHCKYVLLVQKGKKEEQKKENRFEKR